MTKKQLFTPFLPLKDIQFFAEKGAKEKLEERLNEIEQRSAAIEQEIEKGEGDFKELRSDLKKLDDEKEDIEERLNYLRQKEEAASMESGKQKGTKKREIFFPSGNQQEGEVDVRSLKWDEAIKSDEYRTAWAKDMMGKNLSDEERDLMDKVNDEYREFIHDTENTQILIPKTVTEGIWTRAEEESSLWADVRKFFVTGNLTMLKGQPSDDAKWYDEEDTVGLDELKFGQVNLTGCELAKAVAVTWKLKKMSVQQFEAYIIEEIGRRMGTSLAYGVYAGQGKPSTGDDFKAEPYGIKTRLEGNEDFAAQLRTYNPEGIEYTDLTAMMGAIFSAYASGATIYASNTTIWNVLANLRDNAGQPLFVADVMSGGVGRIFGRTVKPDAAIPEGEIMMGNLNRGYIANVNEGVTMHRQTHMRLRVDEYMGYAIVDGDVLDHKAFVILQPDTPEV